MNKKGFTLIELLAVTVILGLMILVVMPNLLSTLADVKEREKTVLRERLQEAALVYAENNKNNIPELKKVNGTVYITLGDLVDSKLLDPPVIDPTTGDEIPLTTYIKITKTASNKFAVTFDVLLPSPPPVITILGDNPITIDKGSTYTDAGATATSSKDGNLTSSIVKTGTVNTTIGGTYYITYSVTDSNGTTVSESRTVIVFVPPAPVNFAYTGAVQTYAIKIPGTYKLEVWGAQGGGDITYPGGKGGYATGNIYLTEGQTINVYVGQQGQNSVEAGNGAGGWNGGGTGASSHGGGGATDIRVNGTALTNRVIVAGSGGGGYITTSAGGYGGGLVGQNSPYQSNTTYGIIAGGTQTSGGTYGGTLGIGGNASSYTSSGGGGGYYGGGSNNSQAVNTAGAGGSSYIGGVQN